MTFDYRTGNVDETGFLMGQGLENGFIRRTEGGLWYWNEDNAKKVSKDTMRSEIEDEETKKWLIGELMNG